MSQPSRSPLFFLAHIKESIEAIDSYLEGKGKMAFLQQRIVQMAVLHELLRIGEAASQLSEEFKSARPQVPWRDIVDFRNVLAHHYWGVDLEVVWKIISDRDKLPELKHQIETFINEEQVKE